MKIDFLPADRKVKTADELTDVMESDLMLRAIKIKNTTDENVQLQKIQLDIKSNHDLIKQLVYTEETIQQLCNMLNQNKEKNDGNISKVIVEKNNFFHKELIAESPMLKPGEETGILMERISVFNKTPIDECVVKAFYSTTVPSFSLENQRDEEIECIIPIK